MAEEQEAAAASPQIPTEETPSPTPQPIPSEQTEEKPEEEPTPEPTTEPIDAPDLKRKIDDVEEPKTANGDSEVIEPVNPGSDAVTNTDTPDDVTNDAKRQKIDADAVESGVDAEKTEIAPAAIGNGEVVTAEEVVEKPEEEESSRKIEVPNNKVGVLIGRSGETIRLLQQSSGAKIQITRDAEAPPNSSTRPVELVGTIEQINHADKLIKAVIAEADAGGSPALVASGFGTGQTGFETYEMQVPNEKVGMIIGKGGEMIKNLQTRSNARIQLIPQHLPEGDVSKERTVRVTGTKKHIEVAKELIKEVLNQPPRPSSHSGFSQGHRPRGPASQWGTRAPAPAQPHSQSSTGYDYQQRGMYPPQNSHYPQSFGSGYPQQPLPRSNPSAAWEQRSATPVQNPPQSGGYDYYAQGGQAAGTQPSSLTPAPTSAPTNYYGQPQAAGYGQPTPYQQSTPQQSYGQGYNEPKYDSQAPSQQYYGQQQPVSSQPGYYPPQGTTPQTGYAQQQPYSKPAAYGGAPESYGQPRASQPGDPMYQGSAQPSYAGSAVPTQQSYPYGSSAPPSQPAPAYGQSYPTAAGADGYNQPPSAGYSQPASQVAPGYGQGGQPVPAYNQPAAQSGGYAQYPSAQPTNVNYGYQGAPGEAGYANSVPNSGYGAAPAVGSQPVYNQAGGYAQPMAANPASYEQPSAQPGYGTHPASAPVGYAKGVSPQPGYGGQYDSAQMYGHH